LRYGRFSKDLREYEITTLETPRPWMNHISNERYGVIVSQSGMGFSFWRAIHAFKLTFAIDDGYVPRFPVTGRVVYSRDRDSGRVWAVNAQHGEKGVRDFSCRHGVGYSVFSSSREGVAGSLRIFVPPGEDPVELWTVTLENRTKRKRRISLFPYVEWFISSYPGTFCDPYVHAEASIHRDLNALLAINTNPENLHLYGGFMASARRPAGYETSKDAFLGRYGGLVYPEAVKRGRLRNTEANAEKLVGALRVDVTVPAGGSARADFVLGVAFKKAEVRRYVRRYAGEKRCEKSFDALRRFWERRFSVVSVKTPDADIDRQTNIWGKQQVTTTQRWTRGLDRGYRDILQDARGFLPLDPAIVRHYLVETLKYQYADGTAMRQWSEIGGPHDLRNYKDSPSWIADTLVGYVKETGDRAILDEKVPYYDRGRATVYEHALAAVETLWRERGRHGLCLMGHGDWNDALNEIGKAGRGESVWLSCAFVRAMMWTLELSELLGDGRAARRLAKRIREMRRLINKSAWDGKWYVYAFNDAGEPVGSRTNPQGKCHLNVQSWAVIADVARGRRLAATLRAIDRMDSDCGPVLIKPAYSRYDPGVGRITAMNPGTFENGSVYTHGGCFKIAADLRAGRPEKAVETIGKLLPSNPKNPSEKSTLEPYGTTNFYCGPENPTFGRALYSFFTAAPAWLHRLVTEDLVGVAPDFEGLRIRPCVPKDWRRFSMTRRFRGAEYEIEFRNPRGVRSGVSELRLDGEPLRGTLVPAETGGRGGRAGRHRVEVIMGR